MTWCVPSTTRISRPGVGVVGKNSSPCRGPDPPGVVRCELSQQLGDLLPVRGDQHFAMRFKKLLDAVPRVGDQASAGARSFEDARRRRKATARHAVAIDIQRGQSGTEESVVLVRPDVTDATNVPRDDFVVPAGTAQ